MDDVLEAWTDFNVALMGATAALAGLVIVAASVNIAEIVKATSLTARLAAGIAGLVLAIVGAGVGLVPGITPLAYGITMIAFALVTGVFAGQAARRIFENRHPANRMRPGKAVVGFVAPVAYLVGGSLLVAGESDGVVWFAAGAIAAIVAGLLISWIALVEVLR
ncbi:hypothetical protein AB1K54_16385 [Microbacterium sp. BWT-B31]|uniref:hypothetical protein n=1 Tax=Microbacterium sp. BWT-B31 TaxID=3232072 RepID=UPI003528C6E8